MTPGHLKRILDRFDELDQAVTALAGELWALSEAEGETPEVLQLLERLEPYLHMTPAG